MVFVNVLLERLGVPIPAMPAMIVGGAAAAEGEYSLALVFTLAVVASLLGDAAWYALGRAYGMRVLRLLCSISLSADSCVRQTSSHFERWGDWTVFLGKFIPGAGSVAPPLAGVMRMDVGRFVILTLAGSALWVGVSVALGVLFARQVTELLAQLEDWGGIALLVVGALVAAYIALKWWERQRFYKTVRMARITVEELRSLMQGEPAPLVVDLRGPAERLSDARAIPGAHAISLAEIERRMADFPKDREIVFYCNCPNEASAAMAAKALRDLGYARVRPLLGGLDAWIEAGYDIERRP
ncbi:MAG TPA: VTT domain-containing protein [Burkholderiales bacterium]|nr:VTT domain-containing protein [Burkholderiales bacterium]